MILGEKAHQHREAPEARVRRERERKRDRDVGDVERPALAERARGQLGEHRDVAAGFDVMGVDQDRQPDQHHAEEHPERDLGSLGGPDARLAERRHPVGDRLHAGDGRASRRECLEQKHDPKRLPDAGTARAVPITATGWE